MPNSTPKKAKRRLPKKAPVPNYDKIQAFWLKGPEPSSPSSPSLPMHLLSSPLFNLAILAVLMEILVLLRKLVGSKSKSLDLRDAVEFLEGVLAVLPTEFLNTKLLRERLSIPAQASDFKKRKWKTDQGPPLSFDDAIRRTAGKYKSIPRFIAMLKRNGYPYCQQRFITQAALEQALELEAARRRKQKKRPKRSLRRSGS